jgi:hypothetical protein
MPTRATYVDAKHDALVRQYDYENSVSVFRAKQAVLTAVLSYYETHTARETCELFDIPFKPDYIKILHRLAPKNMGLGGSRKGSGQKKQSNV